MLLTGDVRGLAELAVKVGADLTVVGPEQPLVLGRQSLAFPCWHSAWFGPARRRPARTQGLPPPRPQYEKAFSCKTPMLPDPQCRERNPVALHHARPA